MNARGAGAAGAAQQGPGGGRDGEGARKTARQFGALPHVRYRPELSSCPHCGALLRLSHPVWAKAIQFLTGPEHVTNLGYRCGNPAGTFGRTVYRSACAEARQVHGHGYGLDVVVRVGHWRFAEHRTREEIWRRRREEGALALSERHVQHLLEVYLALLRASGADLEARLGPGAREHGGLILSLDGLQPEQGNEQLWATLGRARGAQRDGGGRRQPATGQCAVPGAAAAPSPDHRAAGAGGDQ